MVAAEGFSAASAGTSRIQLSSHLDAPGVSCQNGSRNKFALKRWY